MMISPDTYYDAYLKGKTKEEIEEQIKELKGQIRRINRWLDSLEYMEEGFCDPNPDTMLYCNEKYLEKAISAYEAAGGVYHYTKKELNIKEFNEALESLDTMTLTFSGSQFGTEIRTYTAEGDNVKLEKTVIGEKKTGKSRRKIIYEKEELIDSLRELKIGGWKKNDSHPAIFAGTQWELVFRFTNGKKSVRYSGDCAERGRISGLTEVLGVGYEE